SRCPSENGVFFVVTNARKLSGNSAFARPGHLDAAGGGASSCAEKTAAGSLFPPAQLLLWGYFDFWTPVYYNSCGAARGLAAPTPPPSPSLLANTPDSNPAPGWSRPPATRRRHRGRGPSTSARTRSRSARPGTPGRSRTP